MRYAKAVDTGMAANGINRKGRLYLWERAGLLLLVLFSVLFIYQKTVYAEGSMFDSPVVSAHDHEGVVFWTILGGRENWTRNYQNGTDHWWPNGTTIDFAKTSSLPALKKGQHYYGNARNGTVPIGKWEVAFESGRCIHTDNYAKTSYWNGVQVGQQGICRHSYYSGWHAYCADCGGQLTKALVYAPPASLEQVRYLLMDSHYYYVCPREECRHLENEAPVNHVCKFVSYNRYKVRYSHNVSADKRSLVNGYMEDSIHMYNNETVYRGQQVTPVTRLSKNVYTYTGYEFVNWNTKPDGSGQSFENQQEILNLITDENWQPDEDANQGIITLYAQWRLSESTLKIDAAGGAYENKPVFTITKGFGSSYEINLDSLQPPKGYCVAFDSQGGSSIAPMEAKREFQNWIQKDPFMGALRENRYRFLGKNGTVDQITAAYKDIPIILPTPSMEDKIFGGWYKDPEGAVPVGFGGDAYTPTMDETLYAKWVDLTLQSVENYTANNRKGACDLTWMQADLKSKVYKIYRSENGVDFQRICNGEDTIQHNAVHQQFQVYNNQYQYTYQIEYTGFYELKGCGAQGGSYRNGELLKPGGLGGAVIGKFFLTEGEQLTIMLGGQNGTNGGGAGSQGGGNGGGKTTIISDKQGVLLIAGGGGGATEYQAGGPGGSGNRPRNQEGLTGEQLQEGEAGSDCYGAGGGAGAIGGSLGIYKVHTHEEACKVYHEHSLGCYKQSFHEHTAACPRVMYTWCWGCSYKPGIGYVRGWCHICNKDESGGCTGPYFTAAGSPYCGYSYEYQCGLDGHSVTELACEYKDKEKAFLGYQCGYEEGQVVQCREATGGSNYRNPRAVQGQSLAGVHAGDGMVQIASTELGFLQERELKGVPAKDLEAPAGISLNQVQREAITSTRFKITFTRPEDQGTDYYWRVESYEAGTNRRLCVSNTTKNYLKTGVAGYRYVVDEQESHEENFITEKVGKWLPITEHSSEDWIEIVLDVPKAYLHIAPVDVAGNIGETVSIMVSQENAGWPLLTSPINISSSIGGIDYKTVYPAKTGGYFVRADGTNGFLLSYESYMDGIPREDYQIEYSFFYSALNAQDRSQTVTTRVPLSSTFAAGTELLPIREYSRFIQGERYLVDLSYVYVLRKHEGKTNVTHQAFAVDAALDGAVLYVTPGCGATQREQLQTSRWERDQTNSICLYPDGKPPVIDGLDALELLLEGTEEEITEAISLRARDALSGVRELKITIYDWETREEKQLKANEEHKIVLEIEKLRELQKGYYKIEISAADNVGNTLQRSYGTEQFLLTTALCPSTLKKYQYGTLHILTEGYAQKVYVEFPQELLAGNEHVKKEFQYPIPEKYQPERISFQIPYGCPPGIYTFVIHGYKGDRHLIQKEKIVVTQESLLQDIRVRIR